MEIPESSQSISDGPTLLRLLAKETGDKWFTDLCEIAIFHSGNEIHEKLISDLFLCFNGGATVQHWLHSAKLNNPKSSHEVENSPANKCLDQIGPFNNFRKLDDALILKPEKNFTLVFGTNGSGKSSVCLALRCLARSDKPYSLLNNIGDPKSKVSFNYRFSTGATEEIWTKNEGYGMFSNEIAYFDGKVAHSLVNTPAKPEQAIEIAPFGLDVFSYAALLLNKLDRECNNQLAQLSKNAQDQFLNLQKACTDISFLSNSDEQRDQDQWLSCLVETEIQWDRENGIEKLDSAETLLQSNKDLLEPGRNTLLNTLLKSVRNSKSILKVQIKNLRVISRVNEKAIANKISTDTQTRNALLRSVLSSGEAEEEFLKLLKLANEVALLAENNEQCPLCKQELDKDAALLFGKYKTLLADTILAEIESAEKIIGSSKNRRQTMLTKINEFNVNDLDYWLKADDLESANEIFNRIRDSMSVLTGEYEPTEQLNSDLLQIRILVAHLWKEQHKIQNELDELLKGQESIKELVRKQENVVRTIKVEQFRYDADSALIEYGQVKKKMDALDRKIKKAGWTDKRTKLTHALKKATDALVKCEFEKALDAEYRLITDGHGMDHLGVSIKMEAARQSITLAPEISGIDDISTVLSEGEQRLHAISLFFAEANVRNPHILVFDDPSTSFDYNYTEGIVSRLSTYADINDNSQILVFTHNWEFFAKLNESLRKLKQRRIANSQDFGHVALVVERCESVKSRDINIKQQRRVIQESIAQLPEVPTESQIRSVCADIRVWVEGIINKYVFNSLRESYKTKHSATLSMDGFMRVRPLKKEYADTLAKAAERTSGRMHYGDEVSQLILPTPTQLKTSFDEVDEVLNKLIEDRSNDSAFPSD
tara:strand:- start:1033 stop:3681 length:2649 start_codon:yes stop_codon:yes gene_type:complete